MSGRPNTLVVKIGGSVLDELPAPWWDELVTVARANALVLVHGWSRALEERARHDGRRAVFVRDRYGNRSRLTTPQVLEDIAEVSTGIRHTITAELAHRDLPLDPVVGDRGLLRAAPAERLWWQGQHLVELDNRVGPPRHVDLQHLPQPPPAPGRALLVTPLARDPQGRTVNTDADRAAAALASALHAKRLLLVTDVPYVALHGAPVREIDHATLASAYAHTGDGMRKKLLAAHEAIDGGVDAVTIGSGAIAELCAGEGGTAITARWPGS
ncbi:acetylglutamate kinase [Streptomyces sp. ODS28]|uniref:amino acid kinase family protein n=1 Tax=Streptomyces sp. ODS28 TaxID=3136688 RepID=UPI0031F02037